MEYHNTMKNSVKLSIHIPNPKRIVNGVGQTRAESRKEHELSKKKGSLWPDLTEIKGPYVQAWKWEARKLLKRKLKNIEKSIFGKNFVDKRMGLI